jgi:hypothetical protein
MQEKVDIPQQPFLLHHWNKLFIIVLSLFVLTLSFSENLDKHGRDKVNSAFNQAVVVFGTAKALNGVVSLAQGTEVGPPGITIAIGEVLDPVNDLIERFSWIMLAAITSLGIQNIFMNIVTDDLFNYLLLALVVICNLWLFFRFNKDEKTRNLFFRLMVIMIFLRFSVPFMSIANDITYTHFVQNEYDIVELDEKIKTISENVTQLNEDTLPEKTEKDQSFFADFSDYFNQHTELFSKTYYQDKVEQYKKSVDKASDHIIGLIIAFVFQTIVFPLLFLFLLYKSVLKVFDIGR